MVGVAALLLSLYFSYLFTELKRLSFEYFAWKVGIIFNITTAIWLWVVFWTNESETKHYCFLYKPTKTIPYMEMSRDNDRIRSVYKQQFTIRTHSLTFIQKSKSLLPASSVLSRSPMAYDTTASYYKVICTDYVIYGNCQDRFGRFSWSKNDSNYLDVKLKLLEKVDNKDLRLVQNLTMGEVNFNQFMRLKNQLVIAAEIFGTNGSFSPVLIATCPMAWMNNSIWFTRWLTLWLGQTARFLWLCCGKLWTSQRVHMLKSEFLQGWRRTRSFNQMYMWIINGKNLSVYVM